MKHKKDKVYYIRVWGGQILFSDTSDMSIIPLTTEGDCTIKQGSQTTTLEAGREIRVPKGSDAVFGSNKARIMLIHRV